MKVVITAQALSRLEESLKFYIEQLKVLIEKVIQIKTQLLKKSASLLQNPRKGQYEPYLRKLEKGPPKANCGKFQNHI